MGYNGISPYLYKNSVSTVDIFDDISGSFNGSTTVFNITVGGAAYTRLTAKACLIVLGGVVQEAGIDYTINAGQITFTTAPTAGLTFEGRHLFGLSGIETPTLGSVYPATLSTGGPYWNTSGSVGIGTTNPQSALDVRGAITVGVGTVGINSISSTTDIQSWYYTNKSKYFGAVDDTSPQAIYVGASGTAMFMVGDGGNDVNQFTLSTPYDVSTAGASVGVFSVATQETNPLGIDFNPTGTKMFISGAVNAQPGLVAGGEYVHEYSLSTAWTISSATYTTSYNVTQDTAPQGVTFGNNGSKMYVCGSTGDAVYQYSLSTPYSLASGVTYDNISLVLGTNPLLLETAPTDISFNSTGTVLWIVGSANDRIYEFRLGTAWDISTAVFYDDVYIGFNEITITGLQVIPEQNVAYIVGANSDSVFQYSTNTPAIEIASSGVSSVSSIVLNNETRVKDRLYVKGFAHFDNSILTQSDLTVNSSATVAGGLTVNSGVTFDTTTGNINVGTSQTTGTLTLGSTSPTTSIITLGRATTSQTTNIQAGITASGSTKTINIGTSGASGSTTAITIGSATAGATSSVIVPSPTNLLIGTATPTGTASQPLQVSGGAYISGNVGIGVTNSGVKLQVGSGTDSSGIIHLFNSVSSSESGKILFRSNNNFNAGSGIAAISASDGGTVNQSRGNLIFSTSLDGAPTERVRIDASGNVGIGTTNPVKPLDVRGESTFGAGITISDMGWGKDTNQLVHTFSGNAGGGNPSDGVIALVSPNANPSNTRIGALVYGNKVSGTAVTLNPGIKAAIDCYTNTNVANAADTGAYLNFYTKPDNTNNRAQMTLNSNGVLTKPYQPAFLAYRNSTLSINVSWQNISSGILTESYDVGSVYSTSTNGRFVAPVAGKYMFYAGGYSGGNTNGERYAFGVKVNNGGSPDLITGGNYCIVDTPLAPYQVVLNLAANDFVELFFFSAINTTLGGVTHWLYWGGYLLG